MKPELFTDDTMTHSFVHRSESSNRLLRSTYLGDIPVTTKPLSYVEQPYFSSNLNVTVFRNMVKFKATMKRPTHLEGVKRGVCSLEFDGKKRKRMLDCFNSWRMPMRNMVMIHLTYPAEYPLDWHIWKIHLKLFKGMLQRRFPLAQGVWKLELQRRGAPHYHMLIDLMQPCSIIRFRQWLDAAWARIAHVDDIHGGRFACRAEIVFSARHAQNYAAKYCGKVQGAPITDDGELMTSDHMRDTMGRHWGKIGKLDCSSSSVHTLDGRLKTYFRLMCAMELKRRGAKGYNGLISVRNPTSFTIYGIGDTSDERYASFDSLYESWEKQAFDMNNINDTLFEVEGSIGELRGFTGGRFLSE